MPPRSPNLARLRLNPSSWDALHGLRGFRVFGARSSRVVAADTVGGDFGGVVVTE
jgi:hypothetical protein